MLDDLKACPGDNPVKIDWPESENRPLHVVKIIYIY